MPVYGFPKNDYTPQDAIDPADLVECPVLAQAVVDYTGDGTFDRLIDVGLAAKFYAIFWRNDGVPDAYNLLAFESSGWTIFFQGGYPLASAENFVSGTSINVGRIFYVQGGANLNGRAYRIIAYG